MPRRSDPDVLSPRAMARLRAPRAGYVPTPRELDRDPMVVRATRVGRPDAVASRAFRTSDSDPGGDAVDRPGARPRSGRHGDRLPGDRWLRLPVALEGARWQPGRSAVLGVVVVTLLAVAVFGLRLVAARADDDGRVMAPGGGSRAGPSGVTAGAAPVGVPAGGGPGNAGATPVPSGGGGSPQGRAPAPSGAAGAMAGSLVVVHVVGQVRSPGLFRLAAGSRVADALDAAGGPTSDADLARVNLARLLVDGEQVQVPAPGDPDPVVGGGSAPGAPGGGAGSSGPGSGSGGGPAPVALNTADLATLETLPGVGPVLAQRIIDWRTEHGRFSSVDELGEVSGIGEKLLAELTPLVTL